MIDFREKACQELFDRLGSLVWVENGEWRCADDAVAQAIGDAFTLDELKRSICAQISLYSKALRDRAVAAVSPGELASWPIKRAEAAAFAASGNPADAPMLSAEAARRGITLLALLGKVGNNASHFGALESAIGGTDGKHRDAINACRDFASALKYDWRVGWPDV